MKIGEKTFVALSYQLKVDGQVVETVKAESPLQFVYGTGFLLPAFEANLAGLGKGDPFAFRLDAANAYGEVTPWSNCPKRSSWSTVKSRTVCSKSATSFR